ncbi:glutathione S-transferase [Conidiobolus coronatus NRRL 28638]|uniref:Glutathione S-transferase n=1 Tax=Conidiobolus coronatus (strain ATCC 28846 / CBS 209.66 / NRRL 28638) TaxID=796925 RepID=A0A137PDP4_CONC2|nr:glutathione S-transferase [Conidiobolus coronatus NRRL 28638]|eukprot:KXN73117.1 glutathione S-transferase [Conidiobolus coronatus NRRL 28638]
MSSPQITLYTEGTPNGQKVSMALELLNIPYTVRAIDFKKNEQKDPWFLKINPNGRIPAIVDHSNNDFAVFESGAILLYLVQKYDPENKLWPKDFNLQSEVIQWLMFQMGGIGPMQGQAAHFAIFAAEKIPYGIKRYIDETKRLFSVLEDRLQGRDYLVADQLTIADLASFPWVASSYRLAIDLNDYPQVKKWVERLDANPQIVKGLDVPTENSGRITRQNPEEVKKQLEEAKQKIFVQ